MRLFTKTPLVIRLVFLYALISMPFVGIHSISSQAHAKVLQETIAAPKEDQAPAVEKVAGKPVRLRIPRLGMDLSIVSGIYNKKDDSWTLSEDKAHFVTTTTTPNNINGSTFIYGHNRPLAFEPLAKLKKGDIVKITTSNRHTFTYKYSRDIVIEPTESNILNIKPKRPLLTLMTCDGAWSESRRVMFFNFKEVT